jgi:putative ABC transport system permease protein
VLSYVWRDLVRNPRRTLASLTGVVLGVALFSGVLFFIDGSGATLTARAVAPLAIDMQRVLTSPLGRRLTFEEQLSAPAPVAAGAPVTVTLTITNEGPNAAHEVVINDEPPPPLSYVHGTTSIDRTARADVAGQSPLAQGLARSGLNIGTVEPGRTITITYQAVANQAVADPAALPPKARISSREDVVPLPANAPPPLSLDQLTTEARRIPGVSAADGLMFVDLPPGSLHAGGVTVDRPLRLFAFAPSYQQHHPSIRIASGRLGPDTAVVTAEAARALGVDAGAELTIELPGGGPPLTVPISGVADLARATPLFGSRKSTELEDFLYVPNSVIVSPEAFRSTVIPAFQAATAQEGSVLKTFPVQELDLQVDRDRLRSDPARALGQTRRIADALMVVGPGQDYLIDNVSNALAVARDDAAVGKRMFIFLGLPGVVLAAFLAAYAGHILASTQRREQASLRLRGADRRQLGRLVGAKAVAVALAGSVAGAALGLLAVAVILGRHTLFAAAPSQLAVSALIAVVVGIVTIGLALFVPGHRALRRDILDERRELALDPAPAWRRWRIDVVLVVIALVAAGVALAVGAFDAPGGSVSLGQSVSLPSYLLLAPLVAWVGGTLLSVRVLQLATGRIPVPAAPRFGAPVGGLLTRSLRRRSWTLCTAMAGLGLVVAFGVNLVVFASTYDAAKAADARFVVGSDLRITPSVLGGQPHPPEEAARLEVPGIVDVAPVVFQLQNGVLIGPYDQDRADLAAVDPSRFARVAALSDSFFLDGTASENMQALANQPNGVLVRADLAEELSVDTGDDVEVLLARGTEQQTKVPFHVLGRFDRMAGFPQGVSLIVPLATYTRETGLDQVDFFLARTAHSSAGAVQRAAEALQAGPGQEDPLVIATTKTALDKDQSSLTALDVNGLVDLNLLATLLMSVACVGLFVFGLLLSRRREYVTLRAQGLAPGRLRRLVLGEAGVVAVGGLLIGAVIGLGTAQLFVHVLRSLFVLEPHVTLASGRLVLLLALPLVAAVVCGAAATVMLGRMRPTELLREQ